jgi:hypothetical protein
METPLRKVTFKFMILNMGFHSSFNKKSKMSGIRKDPKLTLKYEYHSSFLSSIFNASNDSFIARR